MSIIIAGGAIGGSLSKIKIKWNVKMILGCILVILFTVSFIPAIDSLFHLGITNIFYETILPIEIIGGMMVSLVLSFE